MTCDLSLPRRRLARIPFLPALLVSLLTGCMLAPMSASAQGTANADAPDPDLSREVDALFERWHRPDSPGAAVLIFREGVVVHARGYGMANLEHGVPIRPGTVFDIASISKQFGAFAIALLEEDRVLSVNDDIRTYLPELPDFGHVITIRHLIHHTGGLRDWPGTLSMAGWSYEDIMSFDQILRMAFHQQELNFVPGEAYAYSNTGYNLLAEIVARVSGMSFRDFCEERIFAPLGMNRTHFHDNYAEVVLNRADSYRPLPGAPGYRRVTSNLTALGSSSLFTTVEDLVRWVRNFEDPIVGTRGTIARMEEQGVLDDGDTISYAWGLQIGNLRGLRTVSHGGSWAGYRTNLLRVPGERFAVAVLANTSEINAGSIAQEIARLYLEDAMEPPRIAAAAGGGGGGAGAATDPWAPGPDELREYEGTYYSPELFTSYRLELRNGTLIASHFRTGERTFQPEAPDHFRSGGFGEVHFVRDAEGRITGFTANQNRIRNLRFDRVQ